jgi:hypothetical protein
MVFLGGQKKTAEGLRYGVVTFTMIYSFIFEVTLLTFWVTVLSSFLDLDLPLDMLLDSFDLPLLLSSSQQSGSISSDSSSGRSESPQHPEMSTFDGTGKPSCESFIYQFERTANRRHWRNIKKLVDYLTV